MIFNMNKHTGKAHAFILVSVVFMLTLFAINNVHASRIYKSVDAEGNVTYSSRPPENATHTERIIIPASIYPNTGNNGNSTLDQFRDVAAELEKDRKQREADREAALKKQRDEEARRQAARPQEPVDRYYPVYIVPRHHEPRPQHPPQHPRLPQGQPSIPKSSPGSVQGPQFL